MTARDDVWGQFTILSAVLRWLLRRKLPLEQSHICALAHLVGDIRRPFNPRWLPFSIIVKAIQDFTSEEALDRRMQGSLGRMAKALREMTPYGREFRRFAEQLDQLVGAAPEIPLQPGEAWSDAALADLKAMTKEQRAAWTELLGHVQTASGGNPTKKWIDTAHKLLRAVTEKQFSKHALVWFPLVDKPRAKAIESWSQWQPNPNLLILDQHVEILKGLVWCCSFQENRDLARALTGLALSAYRKVPGRGPRASALGHACVWALGAMPGMEGVGQLALLKIKVKFIPAQKGIEKALNAAAERLGLPADEIEEMAVPAYGLEEVGLRREPFGDYAAELIATGPSDVGLFWSKEGKPLKSVPAAVKKEHAEDLKELQSAVKDIGKMLPAQRDRIDSLFLERKTWPYPVWRERYLDHPLVGVLARRLIWRFSNGKKAVDGVFANGRLVGHNDQPLPDIGEQSTVELWHPLDQPADEVLAWRDWLELHEVRQPFKQAHREIYVLTDAERNTRVYSNRFAAHIIRQHQFNALCGVRGWKNQLRLMVDAEFPPAMRRLPRWNLRAEFWVEGAGDQYGTDTNDTGTFLYLASDQVRFYPLEATERTAHASGGGYYTRGEAGSDQPIPLEQIPPLVFSEIMRDVDLFVGVASVGNDPAWSDGGPEGRYRDYWNRYAFGELSATAQTRRTVLERLIPRLKIAGRCSFADRFLVVKGDLRTYKIHLGSGNILMSPNDQYLCIVPARGSAALGNNRVFLPFEGDNTLSLILSKALLLAEDTKIKDSTIVSQIKRG